jgi:hypothetical protein
MRGELNSVQKILEWQKQRALYEQARRDVRRVASARASGGTTVGAAATVGYVLASSRSPRAFAKAVAAIIAS